MTSIRTASTVQCSTNLIEDYTQTMLPPTAQSVVGCFVVVQNDRDPLTSTELVTVSNQNNLLRCYPDSRSNSGWNHQEILVDGAPDRPIGKVVSFYQRGTLYALAHYESGEGSNAVFGMQRTVANDWAAMPFDPDLRNALGLMRQTDSFRAADGTQFFYGVSDGFQPASFVLVGQDAGTGLWQPVYLEPAASATATYRLLPGYGGDQLTVVTVDGANATFRGGSVVGGQLVWNGKPPVTHDLGQGPITADQVLAVPSSSGDQGFLLLGADRQFFHVAGYDTSEVVVTRLTGGTGQPVGLLSASVGQAQEGLYMVFAIDSIDQRLWLLRQTPSQDDGPVCFDPWVELGNQLAALSCPAVMNQGPELLFSSLDTSIGHLLQQVEQGNWFLQTVESPSPATVEPVHSSTYSTEFITVDAGGNPVPGAVIQITSDRPTVAIVNGVSYHVDSTIPATVASDSSGRVTVATVSTSLVSPALTVSSATMGVQGPFRSDLRSHQRLAGQDPTFPVDGASMKAAGIIPDSVGSDDADALAAKASALGTAAVAMHQAGAGGDAVAAYRSLVGTGFEVDFRRAGGLVRDLSPAEVSRLQADALALSISDIWGDICNFFRHLIDDLEKLVITFADDVVYVAVTLADGVRNFVLKTLAEVGDCIEIFLQAVAALAEKAIDAVEAAIRWLRALFGWDDVLRTKQVVSYYIDQTLKNLAQDFTTTIPKDLIAAFTKAKAEIVTVFDHLEDMFQQGVDFNGIVPASSTDPAAQGGPPLQGAALRSTYAANAVQCNFVQSKMQLASSGIATRIRAAAPSAGFDPGQLLQVFERCFPTAELEQSWQKILSFSKQVHDLGSFLEAVVLDLLEAIKDMVLLIISGIEAVLVALSEIVGLAFEGLEAILTAVVDIPIISQIYKWIAKADLTLLDLISLVIALPATILYKLVYGGNALNPPFTEADVEAITSRPIPWPSFDAASGKPRASRKGQALPEALPQDRALAVLFMLTMFGYTVMDIALDIQAANDANGAAPAIEWPDPTVMAGIVSIVLTVGLQGFGVPYAAMKRIDDGEGTAADGWTIGAWGSAWIPPLLDTAFAIGSQSKKVTRFQGKYGPFLSLGAGAVMLGVGSAAVNYMRQDTVNYNRWNQAAMLLPTFPYVFQPIVLLGDDTPPTAAAQVGLWLIDMVGDLGTGLAVCLALSPDNATPRSVAATMEGVAAHA